MALNRIRRSGIRLFGGIRIIFVIHARNKATGSCILWGTRTIHWSIYQSIHRSILGRVSIDTQSSIDRYIGPVSTDVSTDSLLNDTHGRHIDSDTVSGLSVNGISISGISATSPSSFFSLTGG